MLPNTGQQLLFSFSRITMFANCGLLLSEQVQRHSIGDPQ
jgi:hypothetical protein